MQKFQSHKVVEAAKITGVESFFQDLSGPTLLISLDGEDDPVRLSQKMFQRQADDGTNIVGGYLVRYADGYTSWSPAAAFEEGYTPVPKFDEVAGPSASEVVKVYDLGLDEFRPITQADWDRAAAFIQHYGKMIMAVRAFYAVLQDARLSAYPGAVARPLD